MSQRNDALGSDRGPQKETCCCCFEINTGMKVLSYIVIINSIQQLIVSIFQMSEGQWIGGLMLALSLPTMYLSYFCFRQLSDDTVENREKVSKGWKINFYWAIIVTLLATVVVLAVPSSNYPDQIDNGDGTKEKLTEEKKKQVKMALVMAVAMVGSLFIYMTHYFFLTSQKWASEETLLSNYR